MASTHSWILFQTLLRGTAMTHTHRTTDRGAAPCLLLDCSSIFLLWLRGRRTPSAWGLLPPAVNDARVATVLDLKQHLPPTSKIGEGRCYPLFEEGLQFPTGIAKPF